MRKSVQVASCKNTRGSPGPILHRFGPCDLCKMPVARFQWGFCSQSCTYRIVQICASCKVQDSHRVYVANLAQIRAMRSVQGASCKIPSGFLRPILHRSHGPNLCKIGPGDHMGILQLATCTGFGNAICARLAAEIQRESCNMQLAQVLAMRYVQDWLRKPHGNLATCNLHRFWQCDMCKIGFGNPLGILQLATCTDLRKIK